VASISRKIMNEHAIQFVFGSISKGTIYVAVGNRQEQMLHAQTEMHVTKARFMLIPGSV
jgi:hypothetical protein